MTGNGIYAEEQNNIGYYYGDVNTSNSVDASDALIVLRHAAKLETIAEGLPLVLADITKDTVINSSDALEILKVAAKLSYPVLYVPDKGETEVPDTEDPDVTDPTTTEPTETDPDVTDPTATEPTVTDPVETDPTDPTESVKPDETDEPKQTDEPDSTEPPQHEHQYTAKVEKEPSCTIKGATRYTCRTCGHTYVAEDIEALGHKYYDMVETEATCMYEGTLRLICERCGHQYTEKIPKKEHQYEAEEVRKPDCVNTGLRKYQCYSYRLTDDGTEVYLETYAPALGHDYQISSKTDATCDKDGTIKYKCSRCTSTKTETVEKLGHTWIHHEEEVHMANVLVKPEYVEDIIEPSHSVCNGCGRDFGNFLGSATKARIHLKDVHGGGFATSLEKEVWVEATHHDAWDEDIYEVRYVCQGCGKEFTAAEYGNMPKAEDAADAHWQEYVLWKDEQGHTTHPCRAGYVLT